MRPVRLRVRLLVVSRQIGRAGHLWRSSSRSSKPRSRSRSQRRPSRGPHRRIAASCFVAGYRSSPFAVPRRAYREPGRRVSLNSTLGLSACSSRAFRQADARSGATRRRFCVRERRRDRAAGGERRGDAVRRSAVAGRKRDEEAYPPTKSRTADRPADGGSGDAANGAGREGSEEPPRTH